MKTSQGKPLKVQVEVLEVVPWRFWRSEVLEVKVEVGPLIPLPLPLVNLSAVANLVLNKGRFTGPKSRWVILRGYVDHGEGKRYARSMLNIFHFRRDKDLRFALLGRAPSNLFHPLARVRPRLATAPSQLDSISTQFDLTLPVPCNDEYCDPAPWNSVFCQPSDTPSLVESFTCLINLNQILALAMKVLYSATRVKYLMGIGDDGWQENVAVEFDSGLTAWFDSIPAHHEYWVAHSSSPTDPHRMHFIPIRGTALRLLFYAYPYPPALHPRDSAFDSSDPYVTPLRAPAFTSLKYSTSDGPTVRWSLAKWTAVFAAGVVLFLNVVGGKRTGRIWDTDLLDVHRCIRVLRGHKTRWSSTGLLLDSLEQLVKVAQAITKSVDSCYALLWLALPDWVHQAI
ncbi:hypothetical protein FB451DRAFT_1172158 [Mycena latifolia]|nr:hypothetical protein FB451DRAFT_1172158 [Mycena latifolia]